MAESTFRGVIDFFQTLGVYDVILPFLLIFSIVFAILEKTKVLGTEEAHGHKYTKKNLDAMVAFVIAFLVVASTKLVALINNFLANAITILVLIIMFLILVGAVFKGDEDGFLKDGPAKTAFMVIVGVVIVLIFLHSIPTDEGSDWLEAGWDWLMNNWSNNVGGSIILVIVVIAFMVFVTSGKDEKGSKESSK